MRIKVRHLEVFNTVFEAGSVSRAAERLNLTQPAVSIALKNMEEVLGFLLFHRERGFFAPTKEAQFLYEEASQGLMALARIERRAEAIRAGASGGLIVATNGVLSMHFLPSLIADFQTDYPGVRIDIRVHSSRQIASWVSTQQVDIGLIDAPAPVAGLSSEVFAMECVCVMRRDDPLTGLETVTPADLRDRSVVGVTGDHSIDRQLDKAMADASVPLTYSGSAYYYPIARNLVAQGNSVSIIDPINGTRALGDGVVWRRFEPQLIHETAMVVPSDAPTGTMAELLKDRIRRDLAPYTSGAAPAR